MKLNQPARLQNLVCAYCGEPLTEESRNEEHVIGRRFVPRGKTHLSWNVILWVCRPCNVTKSRLEDDISAITMQPDGFGRFSVDDPVLREEARRKASRSFSERTKKPVATSSETIAVELPAPAGISASISMTSPPQVENSRLWELSHYHLRGFFSFLSYDAETKRIGTWYGQVHPVICSRRTDWGNSLHTSFMQQVADWQPQLVADGLAGGYFKVAVRKHPDKHVWSWALEWNQNFRLIGYLGNDEDVDPEFDRLDKVTVRQMSQADGSVIRLRGEVELGPDQDRMFSLVRDAHSAQPPRGAGARAES
jgi:hypothetical protein